MWGKCFIWAILCCSASLWPIKWTLLHTKWHLWPSMMRGMHWGCVSRKGSLGCPFQFIIVLHCSIFCVHSYIKSMHTFIYKYIIPPLVTDMYVMLLLSTFASRIYIYRRLPILHASPIVILNQRWNITPLLPHLRWWPPLALPIIWPWHQIIIHVLLFRLFAVVFFASSDITNVLWLFRWYTSERWVKKSVYPLFQLFPRRPCFFCRVWSLSPPLLEAVTLADSRHKITSQL